jgi:outer membrane protein assembly factor BamD
MELEGKLSRQTPEFPRLPGQTQSNSFGAKSPSKFACRPACGEVERVARKIDSQNPVQYGASMRFGLRWLMVVCAALFLFPQRSPAPLVYTPGEGWHYESVGGEGGWRRARAKEQLEVAQAAFDKNDFSLASKAARRTVTQWPFSDYAPQAQYILGRCYEAKGQDERAFKAYQSLLEKYPRVDNYDEVVKRQFTIANRFLAGKWFKLFHVIPAFPSMDKTVKLYEQILKNGPYSEVAPTSQMNIGQAHENKLFSDYTAAVKAYETAADRYSDQKIGTDALYKVGQTYNKQAARAEYDQSIAAQAIGTFTDFATLYPEDSRVADAQKQVSALKTEQARGSFEVARFYERNRRWKGALIYYNDVLDKDPNSKYADAARQRIDAINKRTP